MENNTKAAATNARTVKINGKKVTMYEGERIVWTFGDYKQAYRTKGEAQKARNELFSQLYENEREMILDHPLKHEIWAGDTPVCSLFSRMWETDVIENGLTW